MRETYANLLAEYIGIIEILDQITLDDFGDKKTVRKNNKLAGTIYTFIGLIAGLFLTLICVLYNAYSYSD